MRSRPVASVLSAAAIVLLSGLLAACSKQGLGERCSKDNGDDDCDTGSGLICGEKGVCCPSSDRNCGPGSQTDSALVDSTPPIDSGSDTGADTAEGGTDAGDTGTPDAGDTGTADAGDTGTGDGSSSDADAADADAADAGG
jgi:hypothetical protein